MLTNQKVLPIILVLILASLSDCCTVPCDPPISFDQDGTKMDERLIDWIRQHGGTVFTSGLVTNNSTSNSTNNNTSNSSNTSNSQGCQNWDWNNQKCTKCLGNWYISGGLCKTVSPLCRGYNQDDGTCSNCYAGYDLNNGECILRQNNQDQGIVSLGYLSKFRIKRS